MPSLKPDCDDIIFLSGHLSHEIQPPSKADRETSRSRNKNSYSGLKYFARIVHETYMKSPQNLAPNILELITPEQTIQQVRSLLAAVGIPPNNAPAYMRHVRGLPELITNQELRDICIHYQSIIEAFANINQFRNNQPATHFILSQIVSATFEKQRASQLLEFVYIPQSAHSEKRNQHLWGLIKQHLQE